MPYICPRGMASDLGMLINSTEDAIRLVGPTMEYAQHSQAQTAARFGEMTELDVGKSEEIKTHPESEPT